MAVGTYTYKLPICDLCELPWIPVGWKQDSDPRNLPEGTKPLRCGKCKNIRWDHKFVEAQKNGNVAQTDRALAAGEAPEVIPPVATQVGEVAGSTPAVSTKITTIHADSATGIPTMIETVEEMSIEEAKRRYPGVDITRDARFDEAMARCDKFEEEIVKPFLEAGIERAATINRTRCRHRMTDCPICHPKEAA